MELPSLWQSLHNIITIYVLYKVGVNPPYYYLHWLPFLSSSFYDGITVFTTLRPYSTPLRCLALFLAWVSVAIYWTKIDDLFIEKSKKYILEAAGLSFVYVTLFSSNSSSSGLSFAQEAAPTYSNITSLMFLLVIWSNSPSLQSYLIFGAIVATRPIQMTLRLVTPLLEIDNDNLQMKSILKFLWCLAFLLEGFMPYIAFISTNNSDWPTFKSPQPIDNIQQSSMPASTRTCSNCGHIE